ncbi:hypothetical protein C0Q70_19424 [Pomacea canaliculata]|uniref:Arrestin-like N-terminal domain-containing protein n=1 Tax=Pomacea canaliculata TaxID=400727 RepID=A0A2T7NJA6_POMCA|nr:hypothetical protein C0Q70_19424 [Pomacea canaliculata]
MKIEEFDIRFDNEDAVFSAGQNVTGSVVLEISKPTHIFNITIRFEGQAKSSWEVSGGDSNKNYRAYETYIDDSITLYSSDGQGPDVKHPAGHHIYPFSMSLPTSVPSSFEGRRGYVRYQCMAFVDRGWKGMLDCIQDFTVIHHLDLNTLHNVAEPCLVTKEEVYEGCCCDSGVVISKFSLRKTGFVPGEPMMFEISIENKSTSSLCGLSIQLIQLRVPVGWNSTDLSVAVTIGTVPLYDANRLSNVAAPPQRMSIIDPPPSYEECVFGRMTTQSGENADIDADEEQPVRQRRREFRRMPSYPYYNMQVSTENGQQPTTPPSPSQLPPPSYDSLNHHEQALR